MPVAIMSNIVPAHTLSSISPPYSLFYFPVPIECHQALVEISTSGANPPAAKTTSLIPTRGPRRATVVACSSDLVRDLISVCVSLRSENASLKERLVAAQAPVSSASQDLSTAPGKDVVMDAAGVGDRGKDRDSTIIKRGNGAGRVFGQLLALGVFGFLGPQSLEESRRVCQEWRDKCSWDFW